MVFAISTDAQVPNSDSFQVFALNFKALYKIRMDVSLIQIQAAPYTIIDSFKCRNLLMKVNDYAKKMEKNNNTMVNFNPNQMDLRLLLFFFSKNDTAIVALTFTGRYFRLNNRVYRYDQDLLDTLGETLPNIKDYFE
ncbi:MAG: hypothetical protein C5B59_07375 [Bacteroidetes bacterium]|nr:MAG: hypothetical protein C5B59_07375 [Bacteroidota bacterium]